MKILFVFTGGTIGSTVAGGHIVPHAAAPEALIAAYGAHYAINFDYEIATPYTILSEYSTGATLRALCECVREGLNGDYDGIIVTHGTDTLQYGAAALSYALADTGIPICLVGANHPVAHPSSNAIANLRGALRFVCEVGKAGVFVPYRNSDGVLRVHRGTRLLERVAFSDEVHSIFDTYCGILQEGEPFWQNPRYRELPDAYPCPGAVPLPETSGEILCVHPYLGDPYPPLGAQVRYVLHHTYHCGTLNTASKDARRFFAQARERGVPVFLTGVTQGLSYESMRDFEVLGLVPLYNIAPVAAYIKLWMLSQLHPDVPVSARELNAPLAGDIAPCSE